MKVEHYNALVRGQMSRRKMLKGAASVGALAAAGGSIPVAGFADGHANVRAEILKIPGVGAGSCGTAACCGEPVYVSDTRTDPRWADLQHVARELGVRACWSVPILSESKVVVGTFAIHADTWAFQPQRDVFSPDGLLDLSSLNEGVAGETGGRA